MCVCVGNIIPLSILLYIYLNVRLLFLRDLLAMGVCERVRE